MSLFVPYKLIICINCSFELFIYFFSWMYHRKMYISCFLFELSIIYLLWRVPHVQYLSLFRDKKKNCLNVLSYPITPWLRSNYFFCPWDYHSLLSKGFLMLVTEADSHTSV